MYEIECETCGRIGVNPSGAAAESRAETHRHKTGHDVVVIASPEP